MKGVFLLEEPIASLRPMRSLISQPKQTPKLSAIHFRAR